MILISIHYLYSLDVKFYARDENKSLLENKKVGTFI